MKPLISSLAFSSSSSSSSSSSDEMTALCLFWDGVCVRWPPSPPPSSSSSIPDPLPSSSLSSVASRSRRSAMAAVEAAMPAAASRGGEGCRTARAGTTSAASLPDDSPTFRFPGLDRFANLVEAENAQKHSSRDSFRTSWETRREIFKRRRFQNKCAKTFFIVLH